MSDTQPPARNDQFESLGRLVRRLREEAGLSRDELSALTGIDVDTLRLIERGDTKRPHGHTRQRIATALNMGPDGPARLKRAMDAVAEPFLGDGLNAGEERLRPLPLALTPLVGRSHERDAVLTLMRDSHTRLITLTGVGGVGKTRLALAIAGDASEMYADGVVFVDLTAIRDVDLVATSIWRAVGAPAVAGRELVDGLSDHLRSRHMLLVIDNVEHVLPGLTVVSALLAAAPGITVLATGLERTRLHGEHEVVVAPLAVPTAERSLPPDELAQVDAVRLFLERVVDVRPGFVLTAENSADVAEVVRRVDGLPLGLELAAAWTKVLSPSSLVARLATRLPLLTGGARDAPHRQQTLRNTMQWSYDLLGADLQPYFRRLSVFRGGWTLDAAESVLSISGEGSLEVLGALAGLVDKSLVVVVPDGTGTDRFVMLETVGEFAAECLAASGEKDVAGRAHAEHFLGLAEQSDPVLGGAEQAKAFNDLDRDYPNLRLALEWFLGSHKAGDVERAMRIAAALWGFWGSRGYLHERRRWLNRLATAESAATRMRARILLQLANASYDLSDLEEAEQRYGDAKEAWAELGEQGGEMVAAAGLAGVLHDRGRLNESRAQYDEALAFYRAGGHDAQYAVCLYQVGNLLSDQGDNIGAERTLLDALDLLLSLGDMSSAAFCCRSLATATRRAGRPAEAEEWLRRAYAHADSVADIRARAFTDMEAARIAHLGGNTDHAVGSYLAAVTTCAKIGDVRTVVESFEGLGVVLCERGRWTSGVTLLSTAARWRLTSCVVQSPVDRDACQQSVEAARNALGETGFRRALIRAEGFDVFAALQRLTALLADDTGLDEATPVQIGQ